MKTRTQRLVAGMSNRMNRLRMLTNDKGFTLIELMIVIAIIGILAAVAIPNLIEYKNKSYCTATVNDARAIAGAVADYFANPANVTVTTQYNPAPAGGRPYIFVGANAAGQYTANTLLLSASTTDGGVLKAAAAAGTAAFIYACEGNGNCPKKIIDSDFRWDPILRCFSYE